MTVTDAVLACVQALYDAAANDSTTGGPHQTGKKLPGQVGAARRRSPNPGAAAAGPPTCRIQGEAPCHDRAARISLTVTSGHFFFHQQAVYLQISR
jgi:hypothetical protein